MVFSEILNPIFSPLLKLPVLFAVFIISLVISIVIVLAYKYFTDQKLMKSLKEQIKDYQTQIKKSKDNPKRAMKLQKKAMEVNMKYMMQSMKPTLFTFLPIILIFGWLNAALAFAPITPGMDFTTTVTFAPGTTGTASIILPTGISLTSNGSQETQTIVGDTLNWTLNANKKGTYILEYKIDKLSYTKEVIITDEQKYASVSKKVNRGPVKTISINNKELKILNLFGWEIGWLGTYIILSIIFSMALRKLFKVY